MTTLASLENVTRRFGAVTALDDVSLDIESGSIVGLLGPNGAGKSTLLSLLQGLRAPDAGTVTLFGSSPRDARTRIRLGCTPQETALPDPLRVGEVVDFVGAHFPDRVPTATLASRFGFDDLLRRQVGSLSGGQKRRLSVALAFVGRPQLVLLDEPTTGLDVDARRTLWNALRREHASGTTVVVTSHYLEEIEALAERVVVIDGGRVLADDDLGRVLAQVGVTRVSLALPAAGAQDARGGAGAASSAMASDARGAASVLGVVEQLPGVVRTEFDERGEPTFSVTDSDAFVTALVREGVPFQRLRIRGATLEEAFLTLTHSDTDAADAADTDAAVDEAPPGAPVESDRHPSRHSTRHPSSTTTTAPTRKEVA
ncbi:ABC transporter ATP-binding protein [Herbiconiux sp. CPCC 205763]|uniref:ABC transporter ATP-binding protein n=1 Tax=Herbiconiux aconitum TaxID=2970913 RepID=A0ABT2GQM9_9MICO|nr:ABC transporter ATP-binding protein [Herbiconiux aconitum]MCS5718526.1 ABC transporter ATP-binding protein [Herbiconiux aconitum]